MLPIIDVELLGARGPRLGSGVYSKVVLYPKPSEKLAEYGLPVMPYALKMSRFKAVGDYRYVAPDQIVEVAASYLLKKAKAICATAIVRMEGGYGIATLAGKTSLFKDLNKKDYSEEEVIDAIADIAESLWTVHRLGIAHRDLKADNILVIHSRYYLMDFGLCWSLPGRTSQTTAPLWFKSPELILDMREDPRKADIWAMGCLIASMLLKRHIITGNNDEEVCNSIQETLLNLDDTFKDIPEPLANMVKDCLNYDPDLRPKELCSYFGRDIKEELSPDEMLRIRDPGTDPKIRVDFTSYVRLFHKMTNDFNIDERTSFLALRYLATWHSEHYDVKLEVAIHALYIASCVLLDPIDINDIFRYVKVSGRERDTTSYTSLIFETTRGNLAVTTCYDYYLADKEVGYESGWYYKSLLILVAAGLSSEYTSEGLYLITRQGVRGIDRLVVKKALSTLDYDFWAAMDITKRDLCRRLFID